MAKTLSHDALPLSIDELAELKAQREKSPERAGWTRIEQLSRDTAGALRISFSNYKSGYYEKLKKEGKA